MTPVFIAIVAALLLAFLGTPIGISFGMAGFSGLVIMRGLEPALAMLGNSVYYWISMESLIPLPLFVLMGMFVFQSGISEDLFDTANKWLGKYPGGLAMATTMSCTGFAACTGDSMAAAATMGTVAYPSMQKRGYSPRLSTSCIAAGGTLGILIPPSGVFIAYGFLTQTSIRDLFIAGIIPGLVLSVMFLIQIYIMCKLNPRLGPPGASFSLKERIFSLGGVWGMLALFILIIGGLYFGIFTPNEAGAIGAAGAFLLALLKKRVNRANLVESLLSSARITCFIFTLVVGAMLFNTLMSVSGVQSVLSSWALSLQVSRYVILVGILLIYYICGWFMDMLAVTFLTIPVFFPLISRLGFDPVWFGVLMCVLTELALITPPLALNLYVVQSVTKTPLKEIFLGIFPFVITISIFLLFLVLFPQICLFLPYSIG